MNNNLGFYLNCGLLLILTLGIAAGGALGVVSLRVKTESLAREVRSGERQLELAEQRLRALEGRIAAERQPENLLALANAFDLGLVEPDPAAVVRLNPFPGSPVEGFVRSASPEADSYRFERASLADVSASYSR